MNKNNIDRLAWQAVFGEESEKASARYSIWKTAQKLGIRPASIHDLYIARGREEVPLDFTVPAINLRGMVYDMAQSVFKVAKDLNVGALILELARSEVSYTSQRPAEYVAVVLAGAIKEGWRGPVFIQGDHFQTKVASPGAPKEGEVAAVKELIKEAIEAGFYNIDIDTSTLVDLQKSTEAEQQEPNIRHSLELAQYVRSLEPQGITVSLGGEIGHIGGKNSTVEDFRAYMEGFNTGMPQGMTGMSKISIQTGTSHGGVVLPDGTLADIDVDFSVLAAISKACREEYQISGAVQHGASTLPDEFFKQFTKAEAIEVHLATGFQNIILDHPSFPKELLQKMYAWLDEEKLDEREEGWTDEQFHYKLRKKALGQFKKELWQIDNSIREEIRAALEERFTFMFKELNVINTTNMVNKIVKPLEIHKTLEEFASQKPVQKEVKGLDD